MRCVRVIWLAAVVLFTALRSAAFANSCSEIAVGAVLSLTGYSSAAGALTRNGYEFAVQQIRKAGGIRVGNKCYNFRIVYRDDESSPGRGELVAARLIKEGRVRFLLGPNSAVVAEAIAELTENARIPTLMAQGMPQALFAKDRQNVFGLLTASPKHLSAGLVFAANVARAADRSKSGVKLALIASDDPFMADLSAGVLQQAKAQRIEVVVDEKLRDDLVGLPAILSKVRRTRADVLMVIGQARIAAQMAAELKGMPRDGPIIAITECAAARIASKAADIARRILCASRASVSPIGETSVWRSRAVFDQAFKARFKKFKSRAVPDAAAQAALAVHVLATALNRAGTRDHEQVRSALRETDIATFFGRIAFSGRGHVTAAPMVWRQLQGSQYRVVAPASVATHKFLSPRSGL